MSNRRLDPVSYKPFRATPKLSEGLLAVPREGGGELERRVAVGLARMADEFAGSAEQKARELGIADGQRAAMDGAAKQVTVTGGQSGPYRVYTGSGIDQAKALLRDEEGFRDSPYWDVTAHRVGYGSDTTIGPDGRPVKVTPGMKITRDQAERDLDYRLSQREGAQVRKQLGATFDSLPAPAQAALLSVGYNYGSLPDSVVAAGRSGDLNAIADAVAGLSANPKRRQREAAMIRSGGSPAGAPVAGAVAGSAADGPISVRSEASSFRPSGDNTIYGRARDVSGTKTYLQELNFTMREEQNAVYEAYKDNPAMLEKALGQLEQAHLRDHVFPEIADDYRRDFRELASTAMRRANAEMEKRIAERDRQDFLTRVTTLEEQRAQAVARAAAGDDGANLVLARLQADLDSHYDSAVNRGVMTAGQAQEAKQKGARENAANFYLLQANGKTPEEIAAMRGELRERWSRGEEPDLDADTVDKLERGLEGKERDRRARDEVAGKALRRRAEDIAQRHARGLPVSQEEIAAVTLDRATAPDGDQIVRSMQMKLRLADALRTQPIADVERDAWKIMTQDGLTPTPDDYDYAMREIKSHQADVLKDPLTTAERMGILPQLGALPDPNTATPEELTDALTARITFADVAAQHFGVPVKYFRPEEITTLKLGAASTDPGRHGTAMKQLDVVAAKLGLGEVERQFGKDVTDRLQDWQGKVRYATPDEAKQWLKDRNDPQWETRNKPLITKGEKAARDMTIDSLVAEFDDAWFSDPKEPIDTATRNALLNDFVRLTGEKFAVTNDAGKAKEQAIERLKTVWGVTRAFGGSAGRVMPYPPEKFYPTVAGSSDWIAEELATVARERGADAANMGLVADGKTKAAIDRGEPPGYLLTSVNPETGLEELVTDEMGRPLRHFFDPKPAQEKALKQAEEARRTRNDPWLVFGKGTAIGPLYPGGADPADLQDRQKRIDEKLKQIPANRDAYERMKQELPWEGIDN